MPERIVLSEVDALIRPDHYRLTEEDSCFYLREYTAYAGFHHSKTNQLILNLKKGVDRRDRSDWPYKERAIDQIARELSNAIAPAFFARATFTPIPPHRAKGDPLYDDRLSRVLRQVSTEIDARELIVQRENTQPAHQSDETRDPDVIVENYRIDEDLVAQAPLGEQLVVFDDVLTTGSHFVACRRVLEARFPGQNIVGIFVARRVPSGDRVS